MAKKPRTPPPPRRVQAPKRRHTGGGGLTPERRRMMLYGGAGLAAIAVVVVLIAVLAGGKSGGASPSSDKKVAAAMAAAGCTFKSKPVLPPKHGNFHADVPKLTTKVKWSTFPPSGGSHYPLWAVWGFYKDPVNPRMVVHNEEHGGVIIWWGPKVPASTVSKLEDFYLEEPTGMFGTPIAGLDGKIALTAWTGDPRRYYKDNYYGIGKIAVCPRFDENAFTTFRDAYRGKGPEGIPLSADQQGMGPNS